MEEEIPFKPGTKIYQTFWFLLTKTGIAVNMSCLELNQRRQYKLYDIMALISKNLRCTVIHAKKKQFIDA